MFTLGIETSCDETACSVLKGKDQILSNIVSSSLFRHKPFGGVVPEIASRHCLEQMDFVFHEALKQAKIQPRDLNLIAVTQGPGLIGSLFVGISFGKALSYQLDIPLVAVNHLEAHLSANFVDAKRPSRYVGLVVSGGHTLLTYHEKGNVKLLGQTVDDAAGEAYDKVAKILKLGYPGGPIIDRLARKGNPRALSFTRPKQEGPFDFSFSGIKTAVLYEIWDPRLGKLRKKRPKTEDIAASFQNAVAGWLVEKTMKAADLKKVRDLVVGGGVSANSELRKRLKEEAEKRKIRLFLPELSLTGDNAAMIARHGIEEYQKSKQLWKDKKNIMSLVGNANLGIGN